MTCPNCGHGLQHLTGVPGDWAPYLCAGCSRSWWAAELTPAARKLWIGEAEGGWDFSKPGLIETLRANVAQERAIAHGGGG